ncbi:hypothetical protein [Kribbella sp. NPDC048915]|uniref:hypothetical protein n=1 Tax=Kribbella sp. NPDC048915 TaxID=3155148 RepID=UPI0033D82B1B
MADNEGMVLVDRSSQTYQEFARLHRIAQELHPGGGDRWNEHLYARTDDAWGGLTRDGATNWRTSFRPIRCTSRRPVRT